MKRPDTPDLPAPSSNQVPCYASSLDWRERESLRRDRSRRQGRLPYHFDI